MFGDFIRESRLRQNLTLREFCRRIREDPSNWSKIERGILTPPQSREKLSQIAKVLKMKKGKDEYSTLFDQATIAAGRIPEYIMSDEEVVNSLPAFLRTIGSVKPTKEELDRLIEKLRKQG